MQECSHFPIPFPAFIVCWFFDDGHSDLCEVISHCSFDLRFSNNEQCWASFHLFVSHLYVFFGEMFFQVPFRIFDWVVCFSGIELYDLLVYFWNYSFVSCFICYYFLSFWGLSFHLVCSFLCYAKAFNQIPLVYFCFYFHYSRRWVIEDLALIHVIECSASSSVFIKFYWTTYRSTHLHIVYGCFPAIKAKLSHCNKDWMAYKA